MSSPIQDGERGKQKVLIVEDNEPNLRLITAYLESNGFQTESATNPADALTKLGHGLFDLIVSDLRLGTESGIDLCAQVRQEFGAIKFLLYTVAAITTDERSRAQEAGVNVFVHRPAKLQEFLEVIEQALKGS